MQCNVCGNEGRCYRLYEVGGMPVPPRLEAGMLFAICSQCLNRLIEPIRTEATKIETPEDVPIHEMVARRQEKLDSMRKGQK